MERVGGDRGRKGREGKGWRGGKGCNSGGNLQIDRKPKCCLVTNATAIISVIQLFSH